VLLSWSGEEYGLLVRNCSITSVETVIISWLVSSIHSQGSTAYAEANAASLTEQAIAYLNVDVGVTGSTFGTAATPSLVSERDRCEKEKK
jgi:hypothetical protein